MGRNLVAKASVTIDAPRSEVWRALVTPADIKQYFFGSDVESTWREGSPITWKGEWEGKSYADKGVILKFRPETTLQFSHFSPLSGLPDVPENYHTVTVELTGDDDRTRVSLTQDNNPTEETRTHSEKNWEMVLAGLKKYLES